MRVILGLWLAVILGAVFGACGPIATTAHINEGRFSLVGCPANQSVCLVFDNATGELRLTPKPNLPATGEQKVSI